MNKRQLKKQMKKRQERSLFFLEHIYSCGRKNGKTNIYIKIGRAIKSKHYKPYKQLKKYFSKLAREFAQTIIRGLGTRQPKGLIDSTSDSKANFKEVKK